MFVKNWNKTAVIHGDIKTTYHELLCGISSAHSIISQFNANHICIYGDNSAKWIMAFFAGWKCSSTIIPIDYMAPAEEAAYILKDCNPEVLFTTRSNHTSAVRAVKLSGIETKLILLDDIDPGVGTPDSISIPDAVDDTAIIIYTSGTTGGPKGVMLTYRNILVNIHSVTEDVKIYSKDEVTLALLPFHHIFPLMGAMIAPFFVGSSIVIPPSFATDDIIRSIRDNKVSILISVPRFFTMLHKGIMAKINKSFVARILFMLAGVVNNLSFSQFVFKAVQKQFGGSLRFCPCGGAAIDGQVERDLKVLGIELLTGYGMSEASPMISFTPPGKSKHQTAGRPLKNVEVKIVDGEICVRGENVMRGYYNRPEETAATLVDGYLHTGDLGHLDEDGYLCITGRKKEIIVLPNGKNINPEEIEFKLSREHGFIEEIAVFYEGKTLQALIHPNFKFISQNEILNLFEYIQEKVIDIYNTQVAPYKKLTKFTIIKEELPRTRLGKLKRFELSSFVDKNKKERRKELGPDFDEYNILKDFLEVTAGADVYASDNIEVDLALDSLDKVNLLSFIESSFGIALDEKKLLGHLVVSELAEYIRENKSKLEVKALNWSEIIADTKNVELSEKSYVVPIIHRFFKTVLGSFFRVTTKGVEYIPEGPCIIAPNHQSYFDAAFLTQSLRSSFLKRTFFCAKEKHVNKFILRSLAHRSNVIGVDLNRNLTVSIKKMSKALKEGKNLVIFPEGTRSKSGDLGEFKKLFSILAVELGVPVLPVCIDGAYNALPTGTIIPRFLTKVSVRFLPPVFSKGKTVEDVCEECHHQIHTELKLVRIGK